MDIARHGSMPEIMVTCQHNVQVMSIVKKSLDRSKFEHGHKPCAFWPSLRKEDSKALAVLYDAHKGKARNTLKQQGETEADAVCRLFRKCFLEFPSAKHLFSQATRSIGAQALAPSDRRVHDSWQALSGEERATWESKAKEERARASKERETTWCTVILDEAHFLKNPGAVFSRAVCLICAVWVVLPQCDAHPRHKAFT